MELVTRVAEVAALAGKQEVGFVELVSPRRIRGAHTRKLWLQPMVTARKKSNGCYPHQVRTELKAGGVVGTINGGQRRRSVLTRAAEGALT